MRDHRRAELTIAAVIVAIQRPKAAARPDPPYRPPAAANMPPPITAKYSTPPA
jgi:hypothetical protein